MKAPTIDDRDETRVLAELREDLPGYTPEWSAGATSPGLALLRIFARYASIFIDGLNRVPDRGLLAFLDMLGTHLLPAQAARAPLVFTLAEKSPLDVTLPARSQLAAPHPPKVPSLLPSPAGTAAAPQPLLFATDETITLSRGHLAALYSIEPGSDEYVDHSASLTTGFVLFDNLILTEHAIYLGHDTLFNLSGKIMILLSIGLRTPAEVPLSTQWEYLSQSGWTPLINAEEDDTTDGLMRDGTITLQRDCGPTAKQETFAGHTSYWIRGRLTTALLPDGTGGQKTVPVINTIRARLDVRKSDLLPEAAFADFVTLDPTKDFYPFGKQPTRYSTFYIASKEVFQRQGAHVQLNFTLSQPGQTQGSFELTWEFFDGSVWTALGIEPGPKSSDAYQFTKTGQIVFLCPAGWQPTIVNGVKNYWLRVRIKSGNYGFPLHLLPVSKITSVDAAGQKITVQSTDAYSDGDQVSITDSSGSSPNTIKTRSRDTLVLTAALDSRKNYVGGTVGPVGSEDLPTTIIIDHSSDYLTLTVKSNDGFSGGDQVSITDATNHSSVNRSILRTDDTLNLANAPSSSANTVGPPLSNGTSGVQLVTPSSLQPPVIRALTLQYRYLTDPELPDYCLSRNDFVFEDHSDAARFPDQTFTPFHSVADIQPAVHFGFDQSLPVGLVSLYVAIPQTVAQSGSSNPSPFIWEYRAATGWNELGILDETLGFSRSGMIQFIGSPDAVAADGLGGQLYRIRARLKQGLEPVAASISGIWLNAVWATQRNSSANEVAGTSDGNPGQMLLLQRTPVLEGQAIEVQEWTGYGDGWRTALQKVVQDDMRFEYDPATGVVTSVWVRWNEKPDLYSSSPQDRDYVIERATGAIRFGPPGMIPPAGSIVSATYDFGGGVAGNVPTGTISELHTAVPYLLSVTNPVAASGGADTELSEAVAARGPQKIRNHDRAVAPADYEWLARDASPDVALARCIPITGPDGHAQRGWVTLAVVPRSAEAQPQPTPEFQERILNYIAARVPPAVMQKLRIEGPQYLPVSIRAEVVPTKADQAAQLEALIRDHLNQFLHPLTGGLAKQGWDFGQPVYLSQIAAVIKDTEGTDYAIEVLLECDGQIFDSYVPVGPLNLIAAGKHEIKLTVPAV